MHVIRARNVCEALPKGLGYLLTGGVREGSRAGQVVVAPGPVTTVYECPQERVLTSPLRDANPFFHLAEALWMLAGRDDAAFLNNFVRDFGERFAEPDGTIHGAYGHRWRHALGHDQVDQIVQTLRRDPTSRQCVLQMWDATEEVPADQEHSSYTGARDLCGTWRDRPCNTHAYLRVRGPSVHPLLGVVDAPALDLTVLCRSNDIIWGAYGANAVHFSVLHEYLAAMVGVGVGRYYQVSNNFHAYASELERLARRANIMDPEEVSLADLPGMLLDDRYGAPDRRANIVPMPLVSSPADFDQEVREVLEAYENNLNPHEVKNTWLTQVAWPVLMAHSCWRDKSAALCNHWLNLIESKDWRVACTEWVERRRKKEVA